MIEVEMKFAVPDFDRVTSWLSRQAIASTVSVQEADQYFNAPDRDFARTDEALRIRREGSRNILTYKGPKRDIHTKTRLEIEVDLADGAEQAAAMEALLVHLGYRPAGLVRKKRTIHEVLRNSRRFQICLDDVENLGRFVELETSPGESQVDSARGEMLDLAAELGVGQSERRSYLELLLARQGTQQP